jgi:hypothetical protein
MGNDKETTIVRKDDVVGRAPFLPSFLFDPKSV